jgi:hypothetical protein
VSEKVVGNFFGLAQGGDGAVQITGIPQDDRGDEEVQAGGAMLLIFVGAVANFRSDAVGPTTTKRPTAALQKAVG